MVAKKGFVKVIFLIIIATALFFWIDYLIAREFQRVAVKKGHSEKRYFWISFWLGVVGYSLVIALPDRGIPAKPSNEELPEL